MHQEKFDAARSRRNALIVQLSAGALLVSLAVWWLVAGRPVDWPWNWNRYLSGRATVNKFLGALEADDLSKAYGVWMHDKNWQQHPQQYSTYESARRQARESASWRVSELRQNQRRCGLSVFT